MIKGLLISTVLSIFVSAPLFAKGDAAAGKAKSATCVACHGAAGISTIPMYPNLAGQHAQYIVKQLKAFKDGTRKDPSMSPMAKPLSDKDMEDIAAYYESLGKSGSDSSGDSGKKRRRR
jgi:cytochrome c553